MPSLTAPSSVTRDDEHRQRFERLVLPHLDAAYNLARWLTRNDHDAQDVVQEALVRAMRYLHGLRGESARVWLLQIVRRTCFSWLKENRHVENVVLDDDDPTLQSIAAPPADEPSAVAMRKADKAQINAALAGLPVVYREVLLLRELEDLSYAEIAQIAGIPVGTVMSRLSRARGLMRVALTRSSTPDDQPLRSSFCRHR
jgi:RNA polymerase sigma-70 factor, ECF subfamily